ncbi:MAG TPA: XisI protein [Bacteroidetes bacterium]|nr:XisI protein [Bacteroidota bacterium]
MDKIKKYQAAIIQILNERTKIKYANLDAKNELIIDRENHRYEVVTLGWDGFKRIHSTVLHFDIIDGKIWIQQDQTEYGIANELLEMGVPKSDIVLGYMSSRRRKEFDFAMA